MSSCPLTQWPSLIRLWWRICIGWLHSRSTKIDAPRTRYFCGIFLVSPAWRQSPESAHSHWRWNRRWLQQTEIIGSFGTLGPSMSRDYHCWDSSRWVSILNHWWRCLHLVLHPGIVSIENQSLCSHRFPNSLFGWSWWRESWHRPMKRWS